MMQKLWALPVKWLLLIITGLYMALSAIRDLAIPDEGRYGSISMWMVHTHDYLVPRLDGLPFMHKPPLLHWLTALPLHVFGIHDWVLRLVPILTGVFLLAVCYAWVRCHASRITGQVVSPQDADRLGKLALLILASSLIFMGAAQYVNHDLLVATWISVAVFCFSDYVMTARWWVLLLGYVACALGFLSKGLIGVLIPGMILLPWLLLTGQYRMIVRLLNPLGLLVFVALVLPWPWLMNQQYPGFLHYFFVEQQFDRFSSKGFNNHQPWFFYIGCLLISFFPFLLLSRPRRPQFGQDWRTRRPLYALLLWWMVSCVIFFSIPTSKLIGYILPAICPCAIVLAVHLYRRKLHLPDAPQSRTSWVMPLLLTVLAVAALTIGLEYAVPADNIYSRPMMLGLGMALPLAVVLLVWMYRRRSAPIWQAIVGTWLFFATLVVAIQAMDERNNNDSLRFIQQMPQHAPVVYYHNYFYDLTYYLRLKSPAYVVYDWPSVNSDNVYMQLRDGLHFEPDLKRYLLEDAEFANFVRQHPAVTIIAAKGTALPADVQSLIGSRQLKTLHYRNYDVYIAQ